MWTSRSRIICSLGALLAVSALLGAPLASVGGRADAHVRQRAGGSHLNPANWIIGPVIFGENKSHGVPLHPQSNPGGGWSIDIPSPPGSIHYVTFRHGPLAGKKQIRMRYRVEVAPGVRIEPVTAPGGPAIITLYFQRRGDDWSGANQFETYRWYATFASQMPISPGEHQMIASLSGRWTAVQNSDARGNPAEFAAAKANADEVGFVLGGGTGYGHGIYATGPARIIVEDFSVR